MKTNLPESIKTIEEAEQFLNELFENSEHFHPEDDAKQIVKIADGSRLFTDEEAEKINLLMGVMLYEIADFDPCEYLLELTEDEDQRFKQARPTEF